ncbi:MAG: ATP-binding cassette domain-containing protein [Thermodesulfobacteriota bacterium]|jgi:tungstate transport system ATP-binding protein|nr:MAG: ATP-binding cassette domain-containing protein [Thermodesulfobacteriota bacterium]
MGKYLFKIEDLTHIYEDRTILNIFSLAFEEKKIHAITGPNGSGKTTLCNILGLLLKPTFGKIWYQEEMFYENGGLPERLRKKITMVHQNPFLFHTTVEKNVAYGLKVRNYSHSQRNQKVASFLKLMGIEHLRHQQGTRLSGGETQRVAVARALAIDPEVLILDEFTANVDRNYVKIIEGVIQDVFRQKNITIFLVTHDENQASRIAHTVTHLIDGEVVDHSSLSH